MRENIQFIAGGQYVVISTGGSYNAAVKLYEVNSSTGLLTEIGDLDTIANVNEYFLLVQNEASSNPSDFLLFHFDQVAFNKLATWFHI